MSQRIARAARRAANRLSSIRRSRSLLLAGTALCLFVSSAGLFRRYLGEPGVIGYALAVVAGVCLVWRVAPGLHDRLTERQALALAVLALVALGLVFSIGYPLANSGRFGEGSDRDEALDIATSRLLSGQYPYHARTYLDNPISPMPGALLLAAPFVALGRSAYQNLAWLLIFAVVARFPKGELDNRYTLLMIFSLFLLAPVVVYELVTGSDLMANALYVLIALILLTRAEPGDAPVGIGLKAAFFGVALSSRANFLLLTPLVFAALVRRHGWPRALRYSGISLVAFTVVTLPFWLYDPGGFSPSEQSTRSGCSTSSCRIARSFSLCWLPAPPFGWRCENPRSRPCCCETAQPSS